jgi:deoxyribodipyrimidine photo-lyase
MVTLLWFRRALRLADNPALDAAVTNGRAVVPFYVLDDVDAGEWAQGGASRWWLHGSLASLASALRARGSRLILRRGPAEAAFGKLLADTGADTVYWNRRYEPWATTRDERLKAHLKRNGVEVRSFNSALLPEPWTLTTQKGDPYRVFTPFWKALRTDLPGDPAKDSMRNNRI